MSKRRTIISALLMLTCLAAAATARPVYQCLHTDSPPTIDGRLDDECWQDAEKANLPWKWTSKDKKSDLRTEFRMLYDDEGIYLGVWLLDEHVDNLRARHTQRDDSSTWEDDCIELYLDPDLDYKQIMKLTTNSIGTELDQKVGNVAWGSEDGWRVQTSVGDDAWYIEMHIRYEDFPKVNRGDAWALNLARFAWSTGKFRGACWARGAFSRPSSWNRLGYLVFGKLETAIHSLRKRADTVLGELTDAVGQLEHTKGYDALQKKLQAYKARLHEISEADQDNLKPVHDKLRRLVMDLEEWQWDVKLAALIEAN